MIASILERIAGEYAGKLVIAKVNTDENPEWAIKYGCRKKERICNLNET
jgi:thioredoxin